MTSPFQGLGFVSAHVRDIARARTFYAKTLGLREVHHDPAMKTAAYEIPGARAPLSLHQYDAGCEEMGGRPPGTVSGIGFAVGNVERAAEDLKKRGVTLTHAPFKLPNGQAMAVFADPDGNEYVITQA